MIKLFNAFSELDVRNEQPQEKSDLEKVLAIEAEIIKQHENDERFKQYSENHLEAYKSLYILTQEKLTDVTVTPKLLQRYIDARENTGENTQALIRGMYSAALLEMISTKKPETFTIIEGKNKTFNYLFYCIHNVKNITIHNITGDWTLYNAGRNGSAINITLTKIQGDYILENAGSDNGSATHITLNDIKGNWTLLNAGSNNGIASHITLTNITGDETLYDVGRNGSATNILEEHQLNKKQKNILSQIQIIVENIHALSFEEQKRAHEQITRLQKEIFAGDT